MPPSFDDVKGYIDAAKDTLDILKTLKGLLPQGVASVSLDARLQDAEKALKASEVQLAKSLGYHLCQCTFPPQIMLSKGYHPRLNTELFVCPGCAKQEPSPQSLDWREKPLSPTRTDYF